MPRVCCFVLVLLLLSQGAAFGQTTTVAKPTPSASSSTSTTATKKPSNTGEIYRWVDKNGKVQYSADVPEDRRSTARKVDTRSNIVSSRVPARIQGAPVADAEPTARAPMTEREKCEAAWKQYNESVACFSQGRQGINAGRTGTAISAEAQANCQNMTEPAPCR